MKKKLIRQLVLSVATTIFIVTTAVAADSFESPLVNPVFVVAHNQSNLSRDEQLITKAVLEDSKRNGGSAPGVAPERVRKIAIAGSYALASVVIGENGGGMAVLSKKQGEWQVIGGGGGWLVLSDLEKLEIPRRSAQALLEGIDPNWRNFEPQ